MSQWPEKLEISAEQLEKLDAAALIERIGPWFLGAFEDAGSSSAPEAIKLAGAAYWVWADVGNGGLAQYFTNGALGYPCSVKALRVLNRDEAASYLEGASRHLPTDYYSKDLETRSQIASRIEALENIETPFWNALREEDFLADLVQYVRDHRDTMTLYLK